MATTDDIWDRFIELGHDGTGPIIPAPAYHLYLHLRDRGCTFTVEAGDPLVLVVRPLEALTDDDGTAIRHWTFHLLLLMDYDRRPHLDAHLFRARPAGGGSVPTPWAPDTGLPNRTRFRNV